MIISFGLVNEIFSLSWLLLTSCVTVEFARAFQSEQEFWNEKWSCQGMQTEIYQVIILENIRW